MENTEDLAKKIKDFTEKHPDLYNDLYHTLQQSSIYRNFRAKVLCEREFKCSICDEEISFETPYEQVIQKNTDLKLLLSRENTLIVCVNCQKNGETT